MTPLPPPSPDRRLARLARACGLGSTGLGVLVLLGWATGTDTLTRVAPGLPAMVPNTALMFIGCGLALAAARPSRATRIAVAVAGGVAVITLVEYAAGIGLGVDRILWPDADMEHPGRQSPHTSAAFVLLSAAILLPRAGGLLTALTGAVVAAALLGYALGVEHLRGLSAVTGMAVHTALGLAVLTVGLVARRPGTPPISWLTGSGAGEAAARRMLPVALAAPVVLALLVQGGVEAGWWSDEFALSVMTLGGLGIVLWLVGLGVSAARAHEVAAAALERESAAHRRRFDLLADQGSIGVFETDSSGRVRAVNRRWCEMTGLSATEATSGGWRRALHPDDADRVLREWAESEGADRDVLSEHRLRRPDGSVLHVITSASALRDDDGALLGYLGSVLDVTARWEADEARRAAEERFRRAFEDAPIGMAIVACDGRFLRVNRALCEITLYDEADLLALSAPQVTHPDDRLEEEARIARVLRGDEHSYALEKRFLRSDGSAVCIDLSASVVRDEDGRARYFIAQVQDIEARKRQERELRHLAEHDPLTGLANRRRLLEELRGRTAEARRHGTEVSLVLLDLDHFKEVNDALGHNAGDRVLLAAADILRRRLRETDLVARLGGDEFACVLPQTGPEAAELVATGLVEAVRGLNVTLGARTVTVTASAGVAVAGPLGTPDADTLLAEADAAMYDAKEQGRDRVAVHDPARGMLIRAEARVDWSQRIRRALDEDLFVLHYQPILDFEDPATPRYEGLLRLADEPGELVPPGTFLYIAERYGLLPAIDRWVLRTAIDTLAGPALPAGAELAVNLSPVSLMDADLPDLVERLLVDSGVDPRRLCLEITESAAIQRLEEARRLARRLRRLGCSLALDDFGTGFGSFMHLKHLPCDFLKIDGHFVRDLRHDADDRAVVSALVSVARSTGKRTVAEYVQDAETLDLVRRLGVDRAQGFHLGMPAPLPVHPATWAAGPETVCVQPAASTSAATRSPDSIAPSM